MIFPIKSMDSDETFYVKSGSAFDAIKKAAFIICGGKITKIEKLHDLYYFKYNNKMYCVSTNGGEY